MAMRLGMLKAAAPGSKGFTTVLRRWTHGAAFPPPLDCSLDSAVASPPLVLPEFDSSPDGDRSKDFELGPPGFFSGGSMELMAVPKKKVSKHKRGIRNGPKALKPTPVIIRCRSCGRVKLPHFFCCSGERGITGEQNN